MLRANVICLCALLVSAAAPLLAQGINPTAQACGADNAKFKVSRDDGPPPPQMIPEGKALVYVIEDVPSLTFGSLKIRVGSDSRWIGMTMSQSYMSFVVDPGVHHLCTSMIGLAAMGAQISPITLMKLNAEPNKTYYIRLRAMTAGLLLETVDEDEGQYLVQISSHATSSLKK